MREFTLFFPARGLCERSVGSFYEFVCKFSKLFESEVRWVVKGQRRAFERKCCSRVKSHCL